MTDTTTSTLCTSHLQIRPPAHEYQRTVVARISAAEGWTLHFPDPDTGECDVVPLAGWTVYDNGDAAPYIVQLIADGTNACIISDANEGNCYAVAPPTDQSDPFRRLHDSEDLCRQVLAYVQAGQSDPNLYRMVQQLLFTINGTEY